MFFRRRTGWFARPGRRDLPIDRLSEGDWNSLRPPHLTTQRPGDETGWETMMSHWREATGRFDAMRGTGEDEAAYVAGWSISGLAVLGVIVTVWILGF